MTLASRSVTQVTPRTKAIIPVDFSGQPVAMDQIMDIAVENQLIVIQDAAHLLGASFGGKTVGSIAHMTMFSFHPVKHVTTGEGGIIVSLLPITNFIIKGVGRIYSKKT